MEVIRKGFSINYEVQVIDIIKVTGSGVAENGNSYKASVKIRCSNVIQDEDEQLGLMDKEELLEFRIVCESNVEAGEVNKLFRSLQSNGVIFQLNGGLPRKYQNSDYSQVTVTTTPQQLIQKYHKDMKKAS